MQPWCTSSPHQHLAYPFLSTGPHKSAICRWWKIILISENCPRVPAKIHTKGVMYIKNLEEPILFIISDGKVSATLWLVKRGKMLCVSQLSSLKSDIVTPSSNSFTVLAHFNFSFIFFFFCLIGSLTVLPLSVLLLQRKVSLDCCKITHIDSTVPDGTWLGLCFCTRDSLLFSVTWGDRNLVLVSK